MKRTQRIDDQPFGAFVVETTRSITVVAVYGILLHMIIDFERSLLITARKERDRDREKKHTKNEIKLMMVSVIMLVSKGI